MLRKNVRGAEFLETNVGWTKGVDLLSIEIRKARAEDADDAIPLILSSGPDAFNYVFSFRTKTSAAGFLHRAFLSGRGEFGYRNHQVVVLEGAVVGTGAAYCGRDMPAFTLVALQQILGTYGPLKGPGVIRRGLRVEKRIVPTPDRDMHYIAHLGVSPDFRGQGIGAQLVEHLLEDGRRLGRSAAALDVSVENPRAQALYERLGFKVVRELESGLENSAARVPDHRRMERSLT